VRSQRRGYTLVEMMIVVSVMGALALFSLPKFAGLQERSRLTSARQEVEAAIATARAAAIQKGRTATVVFSNNKLWVTVTTSSSGAQTTVVPATPLDSVYGVTVQSRSAGDTSISFDMRGFASPRLAATGVFVLKGTTRTDSVCVTTAGAIMPRGCSL
jgi:prepilin-type N-terminal cleavage/methylation domain-containing protein